MTTRLLGDMKNSENRHRALQEAGLGGVPSFFLKQVHGAEILRVGSWAAPKISPEGDGLITDLKGLCLCIYAADCLPLFLWEPSKPVVGLFHVGWRGAKAGLPRKAALSFKSFYGVKPQDLKASFGPHVGACCYRVGPEMKSQFRPPSLFEKEGESYLDIAAEVQDQLLRAGLKSQALSVSGACTSCDSRSFYSFRRDKQDSRMMAFVSV